MRVFAIVNPRAASSFAGQKWRHIHEYLLSQNLDVTYRFTEYRFHAANLAQDAVRAGADIIISIGGDGTLNEIVNGCLNTGLDPGKLPDLGIVSVGTGSDLTRTLNIPADYKQAIDIIKNGASRPVDIGKVEFSDGIRKWTRYYANVFDVGLGGNVVRIANFVPKNLGGFLTFLISSLVGLVTYRPLKLKVFIDGEFADETSISIIGAANGRFFGGGMDIAPMACPDDGILEVLYVKDTNIFKFVSKVLLPVYSAGHLRYGKLRHRSAHRIKIVGSRIFLADIDGEEEKAREVEISVVPKAIKIRVLKDGLLK